MTVLATVVAIGTISEALCGPYLEVAFDLLRVADGASKLCALSLVGPLACEWHEGRLGGRRPGLRLHGCAS